VQFFHALKANHTMAVFPCIDSIDPIRFNSYDWALSECNRLKTGSINWDGQSDSDAIQIVIGSASA
jgi:hypothetical protein